MSIDYAHTPVAERQRREKAKTLARWCYDHGVDGRILRCPAELRRKAARAAGVTPPHDPADGGAGATWTLVAELLARRVIWDHDHHVTPPRAATCLECALANGPCARHQAAACRICGSPLHPVFVEEGHDTHPSCDPDPYATPNAATTAPPQVFEDTTLELPET